MKTKTKAKVYKIKVVYTYDPGSDNTEHHEFKTKEEAKAFLSGFEAGQVGDGYAEEEYT